MSTELVKAPKQELITFSEPQVNLIKNLIAKGTTDDELHLFLYVAKRTGLDPLSKQIYCIQRKVKDQETGNWINKMTIQTGIDGYRVVAQRSGDYAGQSEPEFTFAKPGDKQPVSAKVVVRKFNPHSGVIYDAGVGVAFWDEYVQMVDEYDQTTKRKTGNKVPASMWAKMPKNQLAKVAEALALRKAFPQDLSGIYTTVEMEQADNDQSRASIEPVITEDVEVLKKTYLELLDEWGGYVGSVEAGKKHPDNWNIEQTPKNFTLAIESMKSRIEKAKNQ